MLTIEEVTKIYFPSLKNQEEIKEMILLWEKVSHLKEDLKNGQFLLIVRDGKVVKEEMTASIFYK